MYPDEEKEFLEELMGKAKQQEVHRVMNHAQAQMLLPCKIYILNHIYVYVYGNNVNPLDILIENMA